MKALKYALLGAGALALAAAALIAYLAVTFDVRDYEPRIIEMVKAKTGRTLHIKGQTKLSFWPDLGVSLGPVSLSERDSNDAFAEVENARFAVKLRPLLAKELVADELLLQGAHVRVTRFADGRLNIDDLFKSESDPLAFDIGRVVVERSTLSYRDLGNGTSHELSEIHLVTGRLVNGTATAVKLSMRMRDGALDYDVASALAGRLTFDLPRRTYALDEAAIELKGKAGPVADLTAALKGGFFAHLDKSELAARAVSIAASGSIGDEKLDAKIDAAGFSVGAEQSVGETVTAKFSSNSARGTSTVAMSLPRAQWREGALASDAVALEAAMRRPGYTVQGTARAALKANMAQRVVELSNLESSFTATGASLPKEGVQAALAGKATFDLGAQRVHAALAGRVSDSKVKATLTATGFAAPVFTFAADIDTLDTDRYTAGGAATPATGKGFDLASLSALPATGTLRIGALKSAGITAKNVRLVVKP
ncbi:MAG: AsmA family protein [Betaproteobacteria bacterium]|nr:AsmA family protein [Betaproteobacteria bacterium]